MTHRARVQPLVRTLRILAVCGLLAASGPSVVNAQSSTQSAQVNKDGWWNRLAGPPELPPEVPPNPLTDQFGMVPAPPNTVPQGAIAVSATGGEWDKVAAVGLLADAQIGSTVTTMSLTLKEAQGTGANTNTAAAQIAACPITDIWAPETNGDWQDRPFGACGLGEAEGIRTDGTWTFDLTSIANLWFDPAVNLNQNGVLLVPLSPEGATFLVSLEGHSAAEVTFHATPPPDEPPPPPPTFDDDFWEELITSSLGSPAQPRTRQPTEDREPAVLLTEPAVQARQGLIEVGFWSGLPLVVLLLLPLALALAAGVAYSLGPAGNPRPDEHREGAISRALARHEVRIGATSQDSDT